MRFKQHKPPAELSLCLKANLVETAQTLFSLVLTSVLEIFFLRLYQKAW